jgi:hypothetical protein
MSDKAYPIRFKHSQLSIQSVLAASAEIHGEHIALLNSKGKLAALFLKEAVESCSESALPLPIRKPPNRLRYYRPPELPALLEQRRDRTVFTPGYGCLYALYGILKR